MSDLRDACYKVITDREVRSRYPEGMDGGDILTEIRVTYGQNAFPFVSILDVIEEMNVLFPRSPVTFND